MVIEMIETKPILKETLNGYEIIMKNNPTIVLKKDLSFKIILKILGCKNSIEFEGNLDSSVAEIQKAFKIPTEVYLCYSKKIFKLDANFKPFNKIFQISNNQIQQSSHTKLLIIPQSKISNSILKYNINLNALVKITILNIPMYYISLKPLKKLKYVKIVNTELKTIICPNYILEYCNLSNNSLCSILVNAKTLVLSKNRIRKYMSSFEKCKHLDLSENPLEYINAKSIFLNIKSTLVKNTINSEARIILADNNENLTMGTCNNLRILSINNCNLKYISFSVLNLKILKAKNNYLCKIPELRCCRFADLSDNCLTSVNGKNIEALNISKNYFDKVNLDKFPKLKHLNLSFNPLQQYSKKGMVGDIKSSFLITDGSHNNFPMHNCLRKSSRVTTFLLEFIIKNIPLTLYVYISSIPCNKKSLIVSYLKDQLTILSKLTSWHTLFDQFNVNLSTLIFSEFSRSKFSCVLITPKYIFVRNYKILSVYCDSFKMTKISDLDTTHIFKNISLWVYFPIFCKILPFCSTGRFSFTSYKNSLLEMYNFLNHYCVLSVKLMIFYSERHFNINKPRDFPSCRIINDILIGSINEDFLTAINKSQQEQEYNDSIILERYQSDLFASLRIPRMNGAAISNPVFLFMKFNCINGLKKPLIENRIGNLMNLVDFYGKVFEGKFVEKTFKNCIIGLQTPLNAYFLAIKIQKALKAINIDISVGISSDLVFRTELEGIITFTGPVFNKTSRMSDLGAGIFCCTCSYMIHPLIELSNEGERHLKGFSQPHLIYLVKLKDDI